jgi:CRISPR system Cascade subunit CasB
MSLDEKQKSFIGYLLSLGDEKNEDRGALAELRSGLGEDPGDMARVHKHVVPFLPEKRYNDRWYYLIATLFGAFPKHSEGRSLGEAFSPLRQKSDSMEVRFVALLNAHPDDLNIHLRHVVSLLRANEQPLDWFQLFNDLLQWDHPDGHVQLRWARDFYKSDGGKAGSQHDTKDDHESNLEVGDRE